MPLRKWFFSGKRRNKIVSVAVLPRRASVFHGTLEMQLPPDFRIREKGADWVRFSGSKSGMRLLLMHLPFRSPVRQMTEADLALTFRRILPMRNMPEIRYGFLRHAPTLTAKWLNRRLLGTLLHLIQVQDTVYLLLIEQIREEDAETAESMVRSAEIRRTAVK